MTDPVNPESFVIRWRGRPEGPLTLEAIQQKLAQREIGLLHEIRADGRWLTLREFFQHERSRQQEAQARQLEAARQAGEEAGRREREDLARRETELIAEQKRKNDLLEATLRSQYVNAVLPDRGPAQGTMIVQMPKSRGVYIILGLFLGCLGIHNFYAGYHGRGAAQLVITLVLGWVMVGLIITGLWALLEIITVTEDATGIRMT